MKARFSAAPRPAHPRHERDLDLDIEKVVAGGLGLARAEAGVVLVRGALGGERVRARVRPGSGAWQGQLLEVLRPSPQRVSAPQLPTADLAHASYPEQLHIKRELVREALRRIAKLSEDELPAGVAATVPSPREWAYRNGAQYLITPGGLAYRSWRGHDAWTLPQGRDPLVMEAVQAVMRRLDPLTLAPAREIAFRGSRESGEVVAALIGPGEPRAFLRAADHLLDAGALGVILARPAERRFTAGVRLIAGESAVVDRLGDVLVRLSATGFAQINPEAAGLAYRLAAQLAATGQRQHVAVDFYGGSGAIGRHLTQHFDNVLVLDTASEALKRGQQDVQAAAPRPGEGRVTFQHGDARQLPPAGVIVVDPPRAGLDTDARDAIDANTAQRLIYVSCDPATWARDVGDLARRGWALREVVPHDFYPQTSHVEVVSRLERLP